MDADGADNGKWRIDIRSKGRVSTGGNGGNGERLFITNGTDADEWHEWKKKDLSADLFFTAKAQRRQRIDKRYLGTIQIQRPNARWGLG